MTSITVVNHWGWDTLRAAIDSIEMIGLSTRNW